MVVLLSYTHKRFPQIDLDELIVPQMEGLAREQCGLGQLVVCFMYLSDSTVILSLITWTIPRVIDKLQRRHAQHMPVASFCFQHVLFHKGLLVSKNKH